MEIIHWMTTLLEGMDLFKNDMNGNPPYVKKAVQRGITLKSTRDQEGNEVVELEQVDASILPVR